VRLSSSYTRLARILTRNPSLPVRRIPEGGFRTTQTDSALGDSPRNEPTTASTDERFRVLLVGLVGALMVLSALLLMATGLQLAAVQPELDRVMNTAAALTAGAVALLAWIRFRETERPDALFQSSAFFVLFVGGGLSVLVQLLHVDNSIGFSRETPGQAPLYIWTLQRLVAALLLLAGAVTALRNLPRRAGVAAAAIAIAPGVVIGVVAVLLMLARNDLPPLVTAATLERLGMPIVTFDSSLLSTPMLLAQSVVGVLFLATAVAYARLHERDVERRPYTAYLAVGLVIAAFSQFHFALVPGAYSDMVTTGDVLRLAFYFVLGAGVAAAVRHDLRRLRRANETLTQLRESDSRRIVLEERGRLAREVHDGLVQDLWLARLTHGRLAQMPDLPAETREVTRRVDGLLENALAEARQAIVALQPTPDPSFGNLLLRFVEDYGDRYGLEVECAVAGEPVELTGRTQAEVLRICREALNNARKHADAGLVRVQLESDGATLSLRIADNGRGFDPAGRNRAGFGLQGMRERAEALGAQLEIESEPMGGTRVTLTMNSEQAP
jgi:signal transduction histidine kinase